ncbi:hypothetical protein C798_25250 [Herbaspirillum rubrisubalbicans Os34]|uniref:HTH cro/C1-type domain-containing protein n=2 Tax=Herbaspirillum rubrisubalbicans TaxID=80842 RepID=A0A6M3ZYM7_9BURK|nr:hypothetical protein C798_25250 [Herbaspirillum rubrisubalbicans Os34]
MKIHQSAALSPKLAEQSVRMGRLLARLRRARKVKQEYAAALAGVSRNSAFRIEKGDGAVAISQILRYLDAISPGMTLQELLNEAAPEFTESPPIPKRQRVRSRTQEKGADTE